MNKLEFRMGIPAVTREYTPGSCCIVKKQTIDEYSNLCESREECWVNKPIWKSTHSMIMFIYNTFAWQNAEIENRLVVARG